MSALLPAGILRTIPQHAADPAEWFGPEDPQSWDVIAGVKICNDGVHYAVLVPGYVYQLEHDGTGWQLTPEGGRRHGYLVGSDLEPIKRLELAQGPVVLTGGRRYTVSQNDAGGWRLDEDANAVR